MISSAEIFPAAGKESVPTSNNAENKTHGANFLIKASSN
jgi:hypothetical protein